MIGHFARRAMHALNSSIIPAKPVFFPARAVFMTVRAAPSGMRELYGPFHHSTIDAVAAVDGDLFDHDFRDCTGTAW